MSELKMGWYHCGRCGSLFRSPPGNPDDRICVHCGKDPSIGLEPAPVRISVPFSTRARPPAPGSSESRSTEDAPSRRMSRHSRLIIRLVGVWLVLLVAIIVLPKIWTSSRTDETANGTESHPPAGTGATQDLVLLRETEALCQDTLFNYLEAGTPEARAQFVSNQLGTVGRMNRFAESHHLPRVAPETLTKTAGAFLQIPGSEAVEIRWKGHSNTLIDCVFFKEDGTWRLDWDHFARYQPEVWGLFCSEKGVKEAEFRLLVRERVIREDANPGELPLLFAPPRFGMPKDAGQPQARLSIPRGTRDGKLLSAAFSQRKVGKAPFQSTLAPADDEDMVRVRAILRRTDDQDEEGDRIYELVQIKAFHWLSVDDPGVTIEDEAAPETPPEP